MSRRFRICMAKGGRESLRPSYGPSKLTLISREKKSPSRRCWKKLGGHNFDFRAKSFREDFFDVYEKILSGGLCSKVKIATAQLFQHRPILLATRVLPASPNFGQAKHGQNGPAATFCRQGICYPVHNDNFTRWKHPDTVSYTHLTLPTICSV